MPTVWLNDQRSPGASSTVRSAPPRALSTVTTLCQIPLPSWSGRKAVVSQASAVGTTTLPVMSVGMGVAVGTGVNVGLGGSWRDALDVGLGPVLRYEGGESTIKRVLPAPLLISAGETVAHTVGSVATVAVGVGSRRGAAAATALLTAVGCSIAAGGAIWSAGAICGPDWPAVWGTSLCAWGDGCNCGFAVGVTAEGARVEPATELQTIRMARTGTRIMMTSTERDQFC